MLVDSSTLLRTLQPHHPLFAVADGAIQLLPRRGRELHIVPQNLVEVWVVATRPLSSNGLGMTIERAAFELARLKALFHFLPDTPAVHPVWEALVVQHRVFGKPAHDARSVAAMLVHGLTSILTFDQQGFARYPGIVVVHPADLLSKHFE